MKRAIVYLVWGAQAHIRDAVESARSAAFLKVPMVLITDAASAAELPADHPFTDVDVQLIDDDDRIVKTTLWERLPPGFESFLFLDADTRIVLDPTFGFAMAEKHGIAMATAPDYCLDNHWGFDKAMATAGVSSCGQNQYNTGVIFFSRRPDVEAVFRSWERLAYDLTNRGCFARVDQPFLTLAMELRGFNPYTLSANYNYRALVGEHISGEVRIWHSRAPVPSDLNVYERTWPPRRYFGPVRVETDDCLKSLKKRRRKRR